MVDVAPPNAPPVASIAPLVERERGLLLELLRSLTDDDWHRPTPCPEWTVLGLSCHLLGDDLGLLSRRRDQYLGTSPPDNLSEEEFIDWIDALQAEWVRAARRLSPRLVVELLAWTGSRLVDTLAGEELTVRSASVSWAGPEPVPVWLDQLRELSEYWIHRQQLLEAVGEPVDLEPDLLRPILLGLRWAYPHRLSQAGFRPGPAVQISIGDPIDEVWYLWADDAGWQFGGEPPTPVTATASLSADQAWRLLTNNLAHPPDRLDMTGDPRTVAVLAATRAIIGHPR